MRRSIPWLVLSALAATCAVSEARASTVVASTARVGPPPGSRWVGGPWRPWVRPGWGVWGPGWGWGASWRWGPGCCWGPGWGGPGWAVAPAWAWSAPPAVWVMPSWVPSDVAVAPTLFEEQRPVASSPQRPQAAPAQGHWYYCTEPAGYYPDVGVCSRPWIAVLPTPP